MVHLFSELRAQAEEDRQAEKKASLYNRLSKVMVWLLGGAAVVSALFVAFLRSDPRFTSGFTPLASAFKWKADLLIIDSAADIVQAISFFALAAMLLFAVKYFRKGLTFQWVFVAFSALLMSSALSQTLKFVNLFTPIHYFDAAITSVTAAAAFLTALLLPGMFPKLKEVIRLAKEKEEEANTRTERMTASLRQANHAKDEFLAIVSHELRTPLTALTGWVQLLQRVVEDGEEVHRKHVILDEGLKQIHLACQTQMRLVDDLLDLSRMTLGKFSVRVFPCDIKAIVEEVTESLHPNYAAKGISLLADVNDVGFVQGDPVRLRQVLWNLLYNALKFTDKGEVRVTLDRHRDRVRIRIRDTGRGIPVGDLDTIFEKLNKASGPPQAHGGGLGLGLSLVKTIIELHGGTVYVDSDGEGLGSTFTVLIPSI